MSDTRDLAAYRDQNLNPFGGNSASETAYRRAERLATAAHLVTNSVPPYEPVHRSIRAKSLAVLAQILFLRDGFRASGPERVNEIIAELLELATLFEVANAAGYLSRMNVEILGKACASLAHYLRANEDESEAEGLMLEDRYFQPLPPRNVPARRIGEKDISIGHRAVRDSVTRSSKRGAVSKSVRHDAVLKVVREKKRVSVKDVIQAVPGYSEKTIQRELVALVHAGLVKKEGERRWSTYVFVE